jgi:hypothetical protein
MSVAPARRRSFVLAGLALAGLVAIASRTPSLRAQDAGRPPGATYTGKAFTFTEVVPGVYHAVGTGNLGVGCNASVIVNADDVMVIDTNLSPGAAWALREELKAITPKPVRYVVNTHWHWDHAHGNQIYGPDVTVISHEYTRAKLAAGDSTRGRSWDMFITTGLPARIADLKARRPPIAPASSRSSPSPRRSSPARRPSRWRRPRSPSPTTSRSTAAAARSACCISAAPTPAATSWSTCRRNAR